MLGRESKNERKGAAADCQRNKQMQYLRILVSSELKETVKSPVLNLP